MLRHQPALKPVGELRDRALQVHELLVQIGAKPRQLVLVAEFARLDHLVEAGRPRLVVELRAEVGERPVRADGEHPFLALVAKLARCIGVELLLRSVALAVGVLAFVGLGARVHVALRAAFGVLAFLLVARFALVTLVLAALFIGVVRGKLAVDQLQILE